MWGVEFIFFLTPHFYLQELEKLDAIAECKAQMHLLLIPSDPRICGLSEGPQAWLVRRKSQAILRALQHSSLSWVPDTQGYPWRAERRLLQRLVQAKRRLESLQVLLTDHTHLGQSPLRAVLGPKAQSPVEGFLENEVLELRQLVGTLQNDLDCLFKQLKGKPPCTFHRCAAVAQALWTGRLPQPWRPHAPAGQQPPWQWLRQQSRRGQLLVRYLGKRTDTETGVPERIFHLSAFSHPRRLLLALRWEAVRRQHMPGSNIPGSPGFSHLPCKHQELNNNPLCLRVS